MPTIGKEEQTRRERMMQSVLGTHAMEGMFPDAATLTIMRRYEIGESSMEEFSAAMEAHAYSLVPKPTVAA